MPPTLLLATVAEEIVVLNEKNGKPFIKLIENNKEYLEEFEKLKEAAIYGKTLGLEIHGGHGLTFDSVKYIASIPEIRELNIGHFLISQAVFDGIEKTINTMRLEIDKSQK